MKQDSLHQALKKKDLEYRSLSKTDDPIFQGKKCMMICPERKYNTSFRKFVNDWVHVYFYNHEWVEKMEWECLFV